MFSLSEIAGNVDRGNQDRVGCLIEQALKSGYPPEEILNQGLIAGMSIVGRKFRLGEYFIPNVLLAARAMNRGIALLEPHLKKSGFTSRGKIILGTVAGDLHDIGKTLAGIMFKGAGFQIVDLGTDVKLDQFLRAVQSEKPDFVGLSALLTTTMLNMGKTIDLLRQHQIHIPVIIGGAPTSQAYADEIKADFWANTAQDGVDFVLKRLAI